MMETLVILMGGQQLAEIVHQLLRHDRPKHRCHCHSLGRMSSTTSLDSPTGKYYPKQLGVPLASGNCNGEGVELPIYKII